MTYWLLCRWSSQCPAPAAPAAAATAPTWLSGTPSKITCTPELEERKYYHFDVLSEYNFFKCFGMVKNRSFMEKISKCSLHYLLEMFMMKRWFFLIKVFLLLDTQCGRGSQSQQQLEAQRSTQVANICQFISTYVILEKSIQKIHISISIIMHVYIYISFSLDRDNNSLSQGHKCDFTVTKL